MVAAGTLLDLGLAFWARLADLAHGRERSLIVTVVVLHPSLELCASLGFVHRRMTQDTESATAGLAGQDVSVFRRGREATPGAFGRWAGVESFLGGQVASGRLFEPSGSLQVSQGLFGPGVDMRDVDDLP